MLLGGKEEKARLALRGQISGLRERGGGDGWTNKRLDERKSPCVLQDFVPFSAAAQKALTIVYDIMNHVLTLLFHHFVVDHFFA